MPLGIDDEQGAMILQQDGGRVPQVLPRLPIHNDLPLRLPRQINQRNGITAWHRLGRRGGQVQLRVCDRGPGVPEAYRERIFEAFFRMPGHAEREGGVGLGLSLVRQIAERHGGRVRCEPREGGGSCFLLELPGA